MKEIIGMIQILSGMGTDTYLKCKYIFLAASTGHQGTHDFISKLFEHTDKRRPPLIEMKKGA